MATAELLIQSATRNAVMLERLKSGEVEKIAPFLRRIDKDLRDRLSRDTLTDYSRARLEQMLKSLAAMLAKIHGEFTSQLLLGLFDIGAYGASMASNYNSRPRPAEVLLRGCEAKLIRRRETLEDLLKTQPGA